MRGFCSVTGRVSVVGILDVPDEVIDEVVPMC